MMCHRSVVLLSSSLYSYVLPICLDILSFNQLTDEVRRNSDWFKEVSWRQASNNCINNRTNNFTFFVPWLLHIFLLMYEANIVQGTLLACLTNLSYLLHLFSPLWRFVSDFGSSVLLLFSACCSLCLILFCIFSLFIASTISRSNFFFPLFFPDLLKFLHPV